MAKRKKITIPCITWRIHYKGGAYMDTNKPGMLEVMRTKPNVVKIEKLNGDK